MPRLYQGLGKEKLKALKRLGTPKLRRGEGKYLVAGERAVRESLARGGELLELLVTGEERRLEEEVPVFVVGSGEMAEVTGLESLPEVAGVFREPGASFPFKPWPEKACVLYGIQDPGNMGTMLRTALAFGVRDMVVLKGCTDPYGTKAARAAMGTLPGLRLAWGIEPAVFLEALKRLTVRLMCLDPEGAQAVAPAMGKTIVAVGAEGSGFSGWAIDRGSRVHLRGVSGKTPLNAAQALTLGLYQVFGETGG